MTDARDYPFRNLVFEGGGMKGIAYVGAMEELRQRGIMSRILRVGGTSAGAINAVLVGLNYTEKEMHDILWNLDFRRFLDDTWGIVRDTSRLLREFGWYRGDFFRKWIGALIREKTGNSESTFADVAAMREARGFKWLYFMGTNLSTRFSEIFSHQHTPDMCVADAVRISMSIPLFFAAKRNPRGDVYVDGGVLANYPIKLFDRENYLSDPRHARVTDYYERINPPAPDASGHAPRYVYNCETLGFRLDAREEISLFQGHSEPVHHSIRDFFDYAWSLIATYLEAQQNTHLHSDDWQRTVYIDTLGVGTTQFDLSDTMKMRLVESGREGVRNYFEWYDHATSPPPVNRPAFLK